MSLSSWLVAGIVPGVERQPLKKLAVDESALLKLLHRWREEAAKQGIGSSASRSLSRPAVTVSGWHAGLGRATSRPMSFTHRASQYRASTGAPRPTVSIPIYSNALFSAGCAANHCKMVAIPTIEDEDAKRPHREHESLVGGQSRIVNR
jgi:transposase